MAKASVSLTKDKLAKLSKEQKLALLDGFEEKARRKREARNAFIPHAGQLPIILDPIKIRIVICGNGFGKTAQGANEAIWAANGFNPITGKYSRVPAKVFVVLDAPEKIDSVWLPELRKWTNIKDEQLEKRGKPYYSAITFENGSVIRFLFHLAEPMSFESLEGSAFIFDEPPPRAVWTALMRAGRAKGANARYLLLGTPISQAWLREYHEEWQKGLFPDTKFFKGSTVDNQDNLDAGYIDAFARHLSEREQRTRLHGDFFNTDGLALSKIFNSREHVKPASELPMDWQSWPGVIAIDPHPNKPTHACLLLAGPQGQLVYAEERQAKEVPRDWALWVKANWLQQYRILDIVTDNFGSGDFTGGEGFKSFVEVWRATGVNVRPTSYDEKLDAAFLERLQDALYIPEGGTPKLTILQGRPGIVRDCENVQWKAQKGTETYQPKLEIGNKDYLACLKYALAANLSYDSAKRRVIRPPGIVKQLASQPAATKKIGAFEERWAKEAKYGIKGKRRSFHDDDDW